MSHPGTELPEVGFLRHLVTVHVRLAETCDGDGIREDLKRIVPEYDPH